MKRTVSVVVLGDIGHSPRMKNHARCLANDGIDVRMIGYGGASLEKDITDNENIQIIKMTQPPNYNFVLKRYVNYIIKCIWQSITLLCCIGLPDYILLQNPPSIPVLPICFIYTKLLQLLGKKTELIIDWHNYGYSIMALSLGKKGTVEHPLVRLSRLLEGYFGSYVKKSFCVSNAMKEDLREKFGANAVTLYDKPKESWGPISTEESHNLFTRLGEIYPEFLGGTFTDKKCTTAFTEFDDGKYFWIQQRPAILISSTSWTEDEDFGILLESLIEYDSAVNLEECPNLPKLLCVITGKGPQKEYYRNLISQQVWRNVWIVTPWLEPEDYPKLLASADLGISLHTSSSGVDLPMKVVDMFGCELPVAAYKDDNFVALPELVIEGLTGKIFTCQNSLTKCLKDWFLDFGTQEYEDRKNNFKNNIRQVQRENWEQHWNKVAKPFFNKL